MYYTKKVTDSVTWVGGVDRRLALFENLFPIENGVSYNSYLIMDDKTALLDTADSAISLQFFENVEHTLDGRSLDYLIVNHMEPDHCACIGELIRRYPEMKIVGNAQTFKFIKQFFDVELGEKAVTVKEGDKLSLGTHELAFYMAPMVHWPEVMATYDATEKILFSADAFGTFGAMNGTIFNDEEDFEGEWLDDARRYYSNIVGKYGPQVQAVLKKLKGLDIAMIAPLHGPVWRSNIDWFIDKYDKWSRYEAEEQGIVIAYASMYGDTANAADVLAGELREQGAKKVKVYDVSKTHVSKLISEVFKYSNLVIACPTYNNGIYPAMHEFINDMKALGVQGRKVGIIENGTWAPAAGKAIRAELESMKNMEIVEPVVTIRSALQSDSRTQLEALAKAML